MWGVIISTDTLFLPNTGQLTMVKRSKPYKNIQMSHAISIEPAPIKTSFTTEIKLATNE